MKKIWKIPVTIFTGIAVLVCIGLNAEGSAKNGSGGTSPDIVVIDLYSGGAIKGVIVQEDQNGIVVDLGYGTVVIAKSDIRNLKHPEDSDKNRILKEWRKHAADVKQNVKEREKWDRKVQERYEKRIRDERQRIEEARKKREHKIKFTDSSRIMVEAVLNGEVKTSLLVDTGATSVVISRVTAEQLPGLRLDTQERVKVTLADGTAREGTPVVLKSVEVAGIEVRNVKAVVMPLQQKDSILGMSFLGEVHMRIDSANNELILQEKIE